MNAQFAALRGRAYPMTVITPISPLQTFWAYLSLRVFIALRAVQNNRVLRQIYRAFFLWRRLIDPEHREEPPPLQDLRDLQFIHFARWSLVGARGFHEALRDRYLIFSTNFNGDWHQYLDAFSFTLHQGLDWIWGTSRSYPGAWPVTPFKEYARRHMLPASYYYNAYPGASVRDIHCAQELTEELARFRTDLANSGLDRAGADPAAFRRVYDEFVAKIQGRLGAASVATDSGSFEHAFR